MLWGTFSDDKSDLEVLSSAYLIESMFETPPTWRVKFLYLFPPGTG
jgi:hypothetical protein